jgi:HK97 family phage portal protein
VIGLFKKTEERVLTKSAFNIASDGWEGNAAGMTINQDTALRLSAVWTCVRLLTHDISSLPLDAFRLRSGERSQIDPKPTWIDEPNVFDPSETGVDHFSQLLMSLLLDGNSFTLARPSVLNPAVVTVLNPRQVEIDRDGNGEPVYKVRDSRGGHVGDFSALNVIHVPLWRKPGHARGLSPIEAMAQGIGRGMAAEELGARYFGQGSTFGAVLEYPKEVDPDANDVKEVLGQLNRRHRGVKNAWALGAVTGGGQLKELGMKPADAQLIETEEWTLEQVARAYGVPPSLAGSQKPGAVAYASVEQRAIDYVVHGVVPLTVRIEKAYSRLLPRGSFVKFNVNGLLRGDVSARWKAYGIALDKKVALREEIRALEDMPDIGPLGFLESPNNNSPETDPDESESEPQGEAGDATQE